MSHPTLRYDSYRPNKPISRLDTNLRKLDTRAPISKGPSHSHINNLPPLPFTPSIMPSTVLHDDSRPKVPQVYDRDIDRLIGRTIRAYRLVINYQRDCPDGHRWMPEHIETIYEAGKNLESDREAFESLRPGLVSAGDAGAVGQVRDAAYALRDYCEEIQQLVKTHEWIPVFNGKNLEWGDKLAVPMCRLETPLIKMVVEKLSDKQPAVCITRCPWSDAMRVFIPSLIDTVMLDAEVTLLPINGDRSDLAETASLFGRFSLTC